MKICNHEYTLTELRGCAALRWTEAELQVTGFQIMFNKNTAHVKPSLMFLSVSTVQLLLSVRLENAQTEVLFLLPFEKPRHISDIWYIK